MHSELGLVYHFGPDKIRGFDKKELVLDENVNECEKMRVSAAAAMQELMDEDTRKLIAELQEKRGENRPGLFDVDEP